MIAFLQDDSAQRSIDVGPRPSDHPVWGGRGWKVYLDSGEDMERVVDYRRMNSIKARQAEQMWVLVVPNDGWLPGIGARRK